jgi:hypothetical protein
VEIVGTPIERMASGRLEAAFALIAGWTHTENNRTIEAIARLFTFSVVERIKRFLEAICV